MILFDLIKLKLRVPSTLRYVAAFGIALAYVGTVCWAFEVPYDFPFITLVVPGGLICWFATHRLKRFERRGR